MTGGCERGRRRRRWRRSVAACGAAAVPPPTARPASRVRMVVPSAVARPTPCRRGGQATSSSSPRPCRPHALLPPAARVDVRRPTGGGLSLPPTRPYGRARHDGSGRGGRCWPRGASLRSAGEVFRFPFPGAGAAGATGMEEDEDPPPSSAADLSLPRSMSPGKPTSPGMPMSPGTHHGPWRTSAADRGGKTLGGQGRTLRCRGRRCAHRHRPFGARWSAVGGGEGSAQLDVLEVTTRFECQYRECANRW